MNMHNHVSQSLFVTVAENHGFAELGNAAGELSCSSSDMLNFIDPRTRYRVSRDRAKFTQTEQHYSLSLVIAISIIDDRLLSSKCVT